MREHGALEALLEERLGHRGQANDADSATNLGLLLGNSGIMPMMSEKAKQPGTPGAARPGAPSFGEFTITEDTSSPG